MAKPPPDRDDGVTPLQHQGYPSTVHVWGAAVRTDFVPFGDGGITDSGRGGVVTQLSE